MSAQGCLLLSGVSSSGTDEFLSADTYNARIDGSFLYPDPHTSRERDGADPASCTTLCSVCKFLSKICPLGPQTGSLPESGCKGMNNFPFRKLFEGKISEKVKEFPKSLQNGQNQDDKTGGKVTRKARNGRKGARGEGSRGSAQGHVAPYYIYVRAQRTRRRVSFQGANSPFPTCKLFDRNGTTGTLSEFSN